MSEATNRVLEAQLRRQKQHDKRQKEWETALKPTTIDGSGVLRQLGQQPLDNRQILPNTASLNRPIRPTAVPGGVVADWLPRVKKEEPEVKTTSLYRPQAFNQGVLFYLPGGVFTPHEGSNIPKMPAKYAPKYRVDGSIYAEFTGDILWFSSGIYRCIYIEDRYYIFTTDNEGWARYIEARGDSPGGWNETEVPYYSLPFMVSRDGITWTTPVLETNIYDALGITDNSDPYYRFSYTTLELNAENYMVGTSPDFSTIFCKSRDAIELYVVLGDYSNAESLSKNGSPYSYSTDYGKTWNIGITNEKSSNHYFFGSGRPCYSAGSFYWGYGDWIDNRREFLFNRYISVRSGGTVGSTSMVMSLAIDSQSIGATFTGVGHGPYTITSVNEETKSITFTPALSDTVGNAEFRWVLLTSSTRTLTNAAGTPMFARWSPPNSVTVTESWPGDTLDIWVTSLPPNANVIVYFAQNYQPLTDTYLADYHGVDPQFAPRVKQAVAYEWAGKDIVVGILWGAGQAYLCPYLFSTTTRISAGDLGSVPPSTSPFQSYTNFYRQARSSEAYRLNSLGVEENRSFETPRQICGVYVDGALIDRFPEQVLPDALTKVGDYWDSTGYSIRRLSNFTVTQDHAGSSLALVVIGKNSLNNDCLFYTTDGLTYNLIPDSVLPLNTILGFTHDIGVPDRRYSGIIYNPTTDRIVIYYRITNGLDIALFSAESQDAITWETTRLGSGRSRPNQLFEGNNLPKKGKRKSPPTLTIN